jgi:hypothetical protein
VVPLAPDSAASGGYDGYNGGDHVAPDWLSNADILWYNLATEDFAAWIMNGAALVKTVIFANLDTSAGWLFNGKGDFDGNGTEDLLLYNGVSGDLVIWFMARGDLRERVLVAYVPAVLDWHIIGVGDFDGDGHADILWRNLLTQDVVMWLMNGGTILSTPLVAAAVASSWEFLPLAIGDFDGDGDADVLWHNSVTEEVALWLTNGATITQAGVIVATLAPGWRVVGVGDFNHDGIDDVLWHNVVTPDVAVWFMNGLVFPFPLVLPLTEPAPWIIRGVGDFDGDGDPDVLLRETLTGDVAIWIMDGPVLVGGFIVGNVPIVTQWGIAGVGDFNGSKYSHH